ncbi:MAG TPA: 2,3-bisphosphoglycerate-independent phosphoglycerate mutase [Candidatus Thermoplasmatota archaeon]|nr:2,3-bisphosphoglycerate-independent phosphoglycerate mutase [Candidatus Thermoplasmatota archaeon]
MPGKALLVILDGFGLRDEERGNAIKAANAPTLARFSAHLSRTHLETSGLAVGLPEGQMGNSEVGHMNIGAGRVIYQTLTRIDLAIEKGDFFRNPALVEAVEKAKASGGNLHLLGLVSDGGVHSSQDHLHALLRLAKERGLTGDRVVVHAFTDGRDTSPTGGRAYLRRLEAEMERLGVGAVATVSGRYHAMDRDKRWERTKKAYDAIVRGQGLDARTADEYVAQSYAAGVTDEFLEPAVVRPDLHVREGDAAIFFNFRPDRARQMSRALAEKGFAHFDVSRRPALHLATMTRYEDAFPFPFAFGDERPRDVLGEVVSRAGLRQTRIAETEKYAHVTYFLNGGEEAPFPREERVMVQSPKHVPTYDHAPEMSAHGITEAAEKALRDGVDLVVINYANCDMVGHTGNVAATVKAVETVDECLGRLLAAAREAGYHVFVTADHGNAEEMLNPDGSPQTAHTTYPVPLFYVGPQGGRKLRPGILADVAPTLLAAMGLEQPKAMTGTPLFQ